MFRRVVIAVVVLSVFLQAAWAGPPPPPPTPQGFADSSEEAQPFSEAPGDVSTETEGLSTTPSVADGFLEEETIAQATSVARSRIDPTINSRVKALEQKVTALESSSSEWSKPMVLLFVFNLFMLGFILYDMFGKKKEVLS